MTEFRIVEEGKLCCNKDGLTAAYKAGFYLQEKGWMRYPPASWDKPAILAFAGDICAAGINYEVDEDERRTTVLFAFCDPRYQQALTKVLIRFRQRVRESSAEEVGFTCHTGNDQMAKAVKMLGLEPVSSSYRLPIDKLRDRRPQRPARFIDRAKSLLARIVKAA